MKGKEFNECWRRLRARGEADVAAIEDVARSRLDRVVMDALVESAKERAEQTEEDARGGSDDEHAEGRREMRLWMGNERLRREVLWEICAEALERIDASLDCEVRSVVASAGCAGPFEEEIEEVRARARECAGQVDAVEERLAGLRLGDGEPEVEARLARVRERLLALRARARSVAPGVASAGKGAWKFGRPLPLERATRP